jgi:hypothetical protein
LGTSVGSKNRRSAGTLRKTASGDEYCPGEEQPQIDVAAYTASLQSQPQLPFWVGGFNGSDTWYVSDPTGTFSNFRFAQAQTTGAAANPLSFSVDPTVVPGTYPLYVRVESSAGAPSVWTLVTIQVLPPTLYGETYNSEGIFEEDQSGNVIVSEGSDNVTVNGNQNPDFPFVPSVTFTTATQRTAATNPVASTRQAQDLTYTGAFNALNPPAPVASELNTFSVRNLGCYSILNNDNAEHDPTLGGSKNIGYYQVFAYCNSATIVPLTDLVVTQVGFNLNTGVQSGVRHKYSNPFTAQILGTYGIYTVVTFPTSSAKPTSGFAERQNVNYTFAITYKAALELGPVPAANGTENYIVNNNGVFYPKIKIPPQSAVPLIYALGAGTVPFPAGPFYFCPNSETQIYACVPDTGPDGRDKLKANMEKAGVAKPRGLAAHHIKPVSWCGSNRAINGVFLARDPHQQFTTWFNKSNFTPDSSPQSGAACTLLSP